MWKKLQYLFRSEIQTEMYTQVENLINPKTVTEILKVKISSLMKRSLWKVPLPIKCMVMFILQPLLHVNAIGCMIVYL